MQCMFVTDLVLVKVPRITLINRAEHALRSSKLDVQAELIHIWGGGREHLYTFQVGLRPACCWEGRVAILV